MRSFRLRLMFTKSFHLSYENSKVYDNRCMLSLDVSRFDNLADLQVYFLKKFIKFDANEPYEPIRMTINGYSVSNSEVVFHPLPLHLPLLLLIIIIIIIIIILNHNCLMTFLIPFLM